MSLSDALCRSYLDLRWHFDPAAATTAGAAGQDDRLGSFDDDSVREHLAAFRAMEAGVEELAIDDAADEIDRTALLDEIRSTIFRLQHERPHRRNPAFWLLHLGEALQGVLPTGGESELELEIKATAALTRLQAMPAFLKAATETLQQPPETFLEIARALFDPIVTLITRLVASAGPGLDGRTAELAEAATEAEAALARFRLSLDTHLSIHAGERSAAVGTEQYERLLHHLHAATAGASEVWRYLLHLEEETEAELRALAAEYGGGAEWHEVVAVAVDAASHRTGENAALAQDALDRIGRFLEGHTLVIVPPSAPEVAPLPEWLVPVVGHATYQRRGVGGAPARMLVAPWDSTAAWISQVAAEGGVPGLHLQGSRADGLNPEIRRHVVNRLTRGGWGLYAVELLYEAGFWATPGERLLTRAYLLLRVLLAQVDVGIHTRQITPEGAEELLLARLPVEAGHGRALVWNCVLDPTRAAGTVLGRRELLQLRDDRRTELGEAFSPASHHEEVLAYGGLPVPLIRWGMGLERQT